MMVKTYTKSPPVSEARLKEEVALPDAHVGGGWADTHAQKLFF